MSKFLKNLSLPIIGLSLLFWIFASVASATDFAPNKKRPGQRIQTVAEPAAIALLGAGLVSLGFYAKKKRGKKQ